MEFQRQEVIEKSFKVGAYSKTMIVFSQDEVDLFINMWETINEKGKVFGN